MDIDILSLVVFLVGAVGFVAEADRLVNSCKILRTDEQATQGIARYEFPGKKRTRFMYALHTLDLPRMIYLQKCSAKFPAAAFTQVCNIYLTQMRPRDESFLSAVDRYHKDTLRFKIACFLCKEGVVEDHEIKRFYELFHACVKENPFEFRRTSMIDAHGRSLLFRACEEQSMSHVELFSDIRDFIDRPDKFGWTPLHVACWEGYTDIARLLCDKGANLNVCTKNGYTPYNCACHKKRYGIVDMLCERGADKSLGKDIVTS
jgi:hypothetical protein